MMEVQLRRQLVIYEKMNVALSQTQCPYILLRTTSFYAVHLFLSLTLLQSCVTFLLSFLFFLFFFIFVQQTL